ncbi:Ig-like domain-containing protein [Cognatishimia sp. F0-27]|uniref:beta strand repeat-containing protein n=1 Tax=Cognatishimia sp. F0-27 TaxID=2816855 RepID=UPI001D0CD7BF|nr:Ig-like domain-containing protein [Cognatishimia sp. F0-27]MCC1494610.1 Ig-like domain-containing protein [Cognatishimia sp. F0-27]
MALSAGDLAIVGYSAEGEDDFAVVVLTDIASNEIVYFTDDEWLGSNFAGGEEVLQWNTGAIAAGTVVTFSNIAPISGSNTTLGTVSHGTIDSGSGGAVSLATSGDSILAYQGVSRVASGGFIAGLYYDETGTSQSGGVLPSDLTVGQTAIVLGGGTFSPDGGAYGGARSGLPTFADYAASVNTVGNWTASDDGASFLPFVTTAFSAGGPDTSAPIITAVGPLDNATNVAVGTNLTITFDEDVNPGTGSVDIYRKSDGALVSSLDVGLGGVSISGATVTVNPPADLSNAERYFVQIDAGAFVDDAGNDFAGLLDDTSFSFTTALPAISAAPAGISAGAIAFTGFNSSGQTDDIAFVVLQDLDGSTNPFQIFFTNSDWNGTAFTNTTRLLTWTVDELVPAGTVVNFTDFGSGNSGAAEQDTINSTVGLITRASGMGLNTTGDEFFAYVGAANAPRAGDGFLAGFNTEGGNFVNLANTGLVVGVTAANFGALADGINGATYNGDRSTASSFSDYLTAINGAPLTTNWINVGEGDGETLSPFNATAFSATGVDTTPPNLVSSTPADDGANVAVGANILLQFNEDIQKGSTGSIVIYDKIGDTVFESIPIGDARITVATDTITINPTANLDVASSYYVQVDAGAIEDTSGNAFGGIADEVTVNFSTVLPTVSTPALSAGDIAFVGLNAGSTETLSFVALTDLNGASTPFNLYFTDQPWEGAAFNTTSDGTVSLTIAEDIAAGTVVTLSDLTDPNSADFESSHGLITLNNNYNHATSGDITYAYVGTLNAPATFLTAISNDEDGFTQGSAVLTNTGLTEDVNAVSFDGFTGANASPPGVEYTGVRSGVGAFSDFRALINADPNLSGNWSLATSNGDTLLPFDATAFALNQTPIVDLNGAVAGLDTTVAFNEATDQGIAATDGVLVAADAAFSDPDGDTVISVTVALTNDQDGASERLIVGANTATGVDVAGSETDTVTLTINGGTEADLLETLQAVRWQNASDDPTTTDRAVTVTASDATASGVASTTTVTVTAADDLAVAVDDSFAVNENAVLPTPTSNLFNANPTTADTDPEGDAFVVTALFGDAGNVGTPLVLASGALLRVNSDGAVSYDTNGRFDALPAAASGASNSVFTESFTYTITGGDMATVQISVNGVDSDDTLVSVATAETLDGGIGFNTLDTVTVARGDATLTRVSTSAFTLNDGAVTDTLSNIQKILFTDAEAWWESAPEAFSSLSAAPYGGPQDAGMATASGDGTTLTVDNNGWKKIEVNKTITADTVLRFDFASTGEGEIHGIGLDTDDDLTASQFFQLDGTQSYGLQFYNGNYTTGSGPQSYEIRVGDYFTGTFDHLTLATDNDAGTGADSQFSNIRFVEVPMAPLAVEVSGVSSGVSSYGPLNGQDRGIATISPDGTEIALSNNAWKEVEVNQLITADTVLRFDFESSGEGEVHGIGFNTGSGIVEQRFFQIDGTQEFGLQYYDDLYTTGSGARSYEIRVGDLFTGTFQNLILTSDNDAGFGADSVFSNISFAEVPLPAPAVEVTGVPSAVSSFGTPNGKDQGLATISVDQTEITLANNAWKKIAIDETITAGTILRFEFKSDVEGEIHGIGFDNDELLSEEFFFQLHGTQDFGLSPGTPAYVTGEGYRTYEIPVGQFFTDSFDFLVITSDNDAGIGADSGFRNIEFDLLV